MGLRGREEDYDIEREGLRQREGGTKRERERVGLRGREED